MSTEELGRNKGVSSTVARVSVVGVGGAGDNLLSQAIGGGVSPSHCLAVNTDRGQLSRSLARNKVLLGEDLADGHGAMGDVELGRRTFHLSAHRVTPFTDASDFTIVVVGLGGGTGTGTAPLIARWARTQARPVVSVVAVPFIHERERRFVALRGLKRMVEACDCTIVIDNAMARDYSSQRERVADMTAAVAVRSLTEIVSEIGTVPSQEILKIMTLGQIAMVCSSYLKPEDTIQSALIEALKAPSAALPLSETQGTILLYRGPSAIRTTEAARAYDTLTSLIGHDVTFVHGSIIRSSDPMVCLLLTGYDYGMAVRALVELLEDLYDVEYGQPSRGAFLPLRMPLFQMEDA